MTAKPSPLAIVALTLTFLAAPALAENPSEETRQPKPRMAREILLSADMEDEDGNGWLPSSLRIDGNAGLEYTRRLQLEDRKLVFKLRGPALSLKSYGLVFEIKF